MKRLSLALILSLLALLLSMGGRAVPVLAAGPCVSPGGTGGCQATIAAAVAAAAAGDTITVAAGTYKEAGITIDKAVSLQGAGAGQSIIDATGHTAGITISGVTSGNTQITGFTIENAGLQGIFVVNSSHVTIEKNTVSGNDKSLNFNPKDPNATTCPDNPNPFTADDCGEAINLQGTSDSTVTGNTVTGNAGGILLDDETGPTAGNTISYNTVNANVLDCGITLASHAAGVKGKAPIPGYGIHDNTINGNTVTNNGAAGIGVFASVPGDAAYNNLIENNTITGNGLPGVTMHAHAPGQNINGNQVIGNAISGNAAGNPAIGMPAGDSDAGDTVSTGILIMSAVVPVHNIVISKNIVTSEDIGIWLTNTVGAAISGNTLKVKVPVAQLGASSVPSLGGPVTLPSGTTPPPPTVAAPALTSTPYGLSASFTVTFSGTVKGQGEVLFGSGPGCTGLVEVATQDTGAGTTNHSIIVTGNELPGTIGNTPIEPGQTYWFEVATITSSGTVIDNNGGNCYSVTIPTS